jgi:hypothetical protein
VENITRYSRVLNELREYKTDITELIILHAEASNIIERFIREREFHIAKIDAQGETIYKLTAELKRAKAFVRIKVRKRGQ